MDPGELHAPRHITHCHRLPLLHLPLKRRQGSGTGLPCVRPEGRSPMAGGHGPGHSVEGRSPSLGWHGPGHSVGRQVPIAGVAWPQGTRWHRCTHQHWHPARGRAAAAPGPAAGTCLGANSGAGVLTRCQRCLSLGLSLLSQALRANIPGIFVMFSSIHHPSEKKKIK